MAAGEDQPEAIVLDLFIANLFAAGSIVDARFDMGNKISLVLRRSARAGA